MRISCLPRTAFLRPTTDLAVSYFIGLIADESRPDSILVGDRNLTAETYLPPFGTQIGGGTVRLPDRYYISRVPDHTIHERFVNVTMSDGSVEVLPLTKFWERQKKSVAAYGTNANLFLFPQ